ncbi:MAG TPA: DUF924 family protein [Rhodanobacteraceae bacterium]|nr:DUF924 family protein [Rhodanobacteraceae bacterium]
MSAARACEVLLFWFGNRPDDAVVIAEKSAMWIQKNPVLDARIRERFGALRESAIAGGLSAWTETPVGRLALIVLVDQFSRNLFRDDARAFEHDGLALAWAHAALECGADRGLRPIERVFAYLPFEHSETLPDQDRAVALFGSLRDAAPPEQREAFDGFLRFAERHRDIIARFGRFPHRNAALGRISTPQEAEFLKQAGSSF